MQGEWVLFRNTYSSQGMRLVQYRLDSDKADKSNSLDMSKSWKIDGSKQTQVPCSWEQQKDKCQVFSSHDAHFYCSYNQNSVCCFWKKILSAHMPLKRLKRWEGKVLPKERCKFEHVFVRFSIKNIIMRLRETLLPSHLGTKISKI